MIAPAGAAAGTLPQLGSTSWRRVSPDAAAEAAEEARGWVDIEHEELEPLPFLLAGQVAVGLLFEA